MITLEEIRASLKNLGAQYEVLLFGSQVTGGERPQSDYDLAIITRNMNKKENLQIQLDILKYARSEYDMRVFELLPIQIQISIIQDYIVVFGDPVEISEYLYQYRKIWNDCEHRILQTE